MFFLSASESKGPELVAILMIVGKSSEFEKMPDAVVLEL